MPSLRLLVCLVKVLIVSFIVIICQGGRDPEDVLIGKTAGTSVWPRGGQSPSERGHHQRLFGAQTHTGTAGERTAMGASQLGPNLTPYTEKDTGRPPASIVIIQLTKTCMN